LAKKTLAQPNPKTVAYLKLAQTRWKLASDAEASSRRDSLEDLDFSIGKQWPATVLAQRELDGRPCLTMNRQPQFVRQITNEQRQQRPALQINPVGDGATTDLAKIFQGCVRHIETISDAEVPRDTAFDSMVRIGFGHWRIVTEEVGPDGEQEIKIKRILNAFTVYWDPNSVEADRSDAKWCFIVEDLPPEEYKHQFPKSTLAGLSDFTSVGDTAPQWITKETIRVAEYFTFQDAADIKDDDDGEPLAEETDDAKAIRANSEHVVMWSKISALEVLDGYDPGKPKNKGGKWAGSYIPIITVVGDELDVNGKRYIAGMVRDAKDPQRMYNYWVSAATEAVALAPKAPFIAAEGQLEGYEDQWKQANNRNFSYLYYKAIDVSGKPVPPPIRSSVEPPIQAMALMIRQADTDLKATIGLYDASLGQKGPDESGKAILARQKQGDVSTLNYSDNMARAIRHEGRVLIDLIPKIYDTPRIQRIINPDKSIKHVVIYNGDSQADAAQQLLSENVGEVYNIGVGSYDVTVTVGNTNTKRQEAVNAMMEIVKAEPQLMNVFGDLLLRNMDWDGADLCADRMQKMLPPQLQDNSGDPKTQLMQAQQQLAALGQQHQALTQIVNQQTEIIKTKQVESQAKIQIAQMQELSQQAIVKMQEATKLAVAQMNASKDMNQQFAENEIKKYQIMHDSAHDKGMAGQQQEHEQILAKQGALQDQQSQASQQQADSQSQDSSQWHEAGMAAMQPQNGNGNAGS
jgi:Phage P22-like portal protein